ncbi:hypothetical protein ABZ749_01145 [Micromonospora sp. NPDC047753]|uniref:hypothetical protein n=1 Tax=Micromonospora sp. NPDC047753 TaxID=3154817 RepID=UPI0033EC7F4C
MKKSITTHLYEPDRAAYPDHQGVRPCLHCPLPKANRAHTLPDTADAQAEHLRRIGDDQ